MRKHWKYWLSVLAVALLLAVAGVWWVFQTRQLPLSECSEVYRQYRHQPGVRAAFIRQMPINDTLRLDMTLLEAEDSAAFADLLRKMGKREEYVREMMTLRDMYVNKKDGNKVRFSCRCLKGCPGCPADADETKNEVVSFFPVRMAVAIFHTRAENIDVVLKKSFFDEIDID